MRLFGKIDSQINRFDRADWSTGGPWWGFDLALSASPPAAPTGLTASGGIAQITLTWVASLTADTYNAYRGTTPGGESGTPIATLIATTTYIDTGRPANTLYYYTVKAVNTNGTSPASNEAHANTDQEFLTASGTLKPGDTNKTITLADGYATWTPGTPGSPTFTISKAPTNDATKNSQVVATATGASINVNAGPTSGILTITDPGTGLTANISVVLGSLNVGGIGDISLGSHLLIGGAIQL